MKKYAIIVLIFMLASLAGGCMPGENISLGELIRLIQQVIESDEDGEISKALDETGTEAEEGFNGLVSDNFYTITSIHDIIDNFASYEFQHSQSHPKISFNEKCKLNYVGQENIDGIMADKVRVEIIADRYEDRGQQPNIEHEHDHIYEIWLDQDGMIFKIARDGAMLADDREMGVASNHINGYMVVPYGHVFLNYHLQLVSKYHLDYVGWQLVNRTSTARDIGNGQIEMDVLDFQTAGGERKYFEIANFNGKNIYTGFYTEFEDGLRQFQMTKMIPR